MPDAPHHYCLEPGCGVKVRGKPRCPRHEAGHRRISTTVVAGPPGAGKSTYVTERHRRGDLVVDMDRLYVALSMLAERDKPDELLPFVAEARDALYRRIAKGSHRVGRAWIVSASPDLDMLKGLAHQLNGRLVVLAPPLGECRRRMHGRPDAEFMTRLARQWFERNPEVTPNAATG